MVSQPGEDDEKLDHIGFATVRKVLAGLTDAIVRRVKPRWIRNRTAIFLTRYERFGPLPWSDLPEGRRLCVVAPHPDDESIGCGGLIARWTREGRAADVVFLTAGEAGDRRLRQDELSTEQAAAIRIDVAAARHGEALAALKHLGASGHWLDGVDGGLHGQVDQLARQLSDLWSVTPPDVVAAPFPADRHPDHAMAARIVAIALARTATSPCILGYEIWSPAPVNTLVSINSVAGVKWAAIAAHRSQVTTTDYVSAAQGLNTYRAISGGRTGFAEGYFRTDIETFTALANELRI
ncbi:PIG-L deacetylase family protein [Roseovarius sp. S4756]|uniref:PIG-L deacetylase family protein n=1 Tax=Roseovarius maritimus TaxID=3342637 RepID=UPI00372A20A8